MLTHDQIASYHRDGYVHVPDVFSESEIDALSRAGRASPDSKNTSTHLFLIPDLRSFWCEPRLVALARALLPSRPVFFGEANYTRYVFERGSNMEGRHLHHDAKGAPENIFNRMHGVPSITYPVLRLGIYFQDSRDQSGGLKVSPGSHRVLTDTFVDTQFQSFNIPSKPGDVICFSMRTLHSPFGMRLRSDPSRGLAPSEEERLFYENPSAFMPSPTERESIFIDFAACHELADLQIKSRALNPGNTKHGVASGLLDTDFQKNAINAGVSIRYDFGIAEVVRKLMTVNPSPSQELHPKALFYLDMLPTLCARHEEWSSHFPIYHDGLCENSRGAAFDIYNRIAARIVSYMPMMRTRLPDEHMLGGKMPTSKG